MEQITNSDKDVSQRFTSTYYALKGMRRVKNKAEFCSSIDMPKEYFSRIENFTKTVPSQFIDKVSKVYGINRDWIIEGVGSSGINNTDEQSKHPYIHLSTRVRDHSTDDNLQERLMRNKEVGNKAKEERDELSFLKDQTAFLKSQVELWSNMYERLLEKYERLNEKYDNLREKTGL